MLIFCTKFYIILCVKRKCSNFNNAFSDKHHYIFSFVGKVNNLFHPAIIVSVCVDYHNGL